MFYERLKELRISLGMNQVQFGNKLMVSKQSVSNWESGYIQPPTDTLIKICRTFSVSADYLLGLSNECILDVSGLTTEQIMHIRNVVNDLKSANSKK